MNAVVAAVGAGLPVAVLPLVLSVRGRVWQRRALRAAEDTAHVEALRALNAQRREGRWTHRVRLVRAGWPDRDGTVR